MTVSLGQTRHYPPEKALFTAPPILCISSPMPRIVAHPSEAKTTKSNAEKSNLFFLILLPPLRVPEQELARVSGGDPKCFDFKQYIVSILGLLFYSLKLLSLPL